MLTEGGDGKWQIFPGLIKQEDEETFYLHDVHKWWNIEIAISMIDGQQETHSTAVR